MLKRLIDLVLSVAGLIITAPILVPTMLLVWLQDFHSPFYKAPRVGQGGHPFTMVKMRSMIVSADESGVDSTSANDTRITAVGRFIRKFKLDELTQLWNVAIGDMSLVGPRPNVQVETNLYTEVEKGLLKFKPGITDISSIVFSDEGQILADKEDPDIAYNQLIRPWKSKLGLVYIRNQSMWLDLKLIWLTAVAIVSKQTALNRIEDILTKLSVDPDVIKVARRDSSLVPTAPPGSDRIVFTRNANHL
jgi:lipopolysaccharide/colanic/teichoic acid biosynthesis glycosyltransferase